VCATHLSVKLVGGLETYAPALKGLEEVHAYTCEKLETLLFDRTVQYQHLQAVAYLYGKCEPLNWSERGRAGNGHGT
jgi:hypothetical protein